MESKKTIVGMSHGRLGNLLFEIATGMYYAQQNNGTFYLLNNSTYDNYINSIFKEQNIKLVNNLNIIEQQEFNQHYYISDYEVDALKYHEIKQYHNEFIYIDGYRENPKYWNNDKDFIFQIINIDNNLVTNIKSEYNINFNDYVSINVRRGDYLLQYNKNRLGLLDEKWFLNCINLYDKNQKFIITSDDIDYCKSVFIGERFIFADKIIKDYNKIFVDLYIQTLCKDNIISNSTFSWWGAYLNKNKNRKVYCPKQFFKMENGSTHRFPENDNWALIDSIWK